MINIKKPRVVKMYQVENGHILFVCSCGRLASNKIIEFNKLSRCSKCIEVEENMNENIKLDHDVYRQEQLFNKIWDSGLSEFIGIT